MTTLARRLDVLEQAAGRCRIRELRKAIGDEIVRRSRGHGLAIPSGGLDAKIDRAMAIMETSARLLASGLTLEGMARRRGIRAMLAVLPEVRDLTP